MVSQLPLADFLRALNRYRVGIIRCHPEVAELPISGTFSIENTDDTLALLTEVLPVQISAWGPYWVTIEPNNKHNG